MKIWAVLNKYRMLRLIQVSIHLYQYIYFYNLLATLDPLVFDACSVKFHFASFRKCAINSLKKNILISTIKVCKIALVLIRNTIFGKETNKQVGVSALVQIVEEALFEKAQKGIVRFWWKNWTPEHQEDVKIYTISSLGRIGIFWCCRINNKEKRKTKAEKNEKIQNSMHPLNHHSWLFLKFQFFFQFEIYFLLRVLFLNLVIYYFFPPLNRLIYFLSIIYDCMHYANWY